MLDLRSPASKTRGQQVVYTIAVHAVSSKTSTAGTVLRSPVPSGLVDSHWRCHSGMGACAVSSGQGDIDQVLGDFSRGDLSFEVSATVADDAPAKIVQAAVAVPPNGGSCAIARRGAMQFQSSPCTARNELATSASILISRSEDYRPEATTIINRFVLDNLGAAADGSVIDILASAGTSRLDWTCVGQGATCPQPSGSGAIHQPVSAWPTSGRLVYDLVSHVESSYPNSSPASLEVTPNARGICAGDAAMPRCAAALSLRLEHSGLQLRQQVDRLGARSGDLVNFTVAVDNDAAAARNVVLSVPLPEGISAFVSWTCRAGVASPTACPVNSGSGAIRQLFTELAPSAALIYSIQARVGPQPPAMVRSRATLTAPAIDSLGCSGAAGVSTACVATSQFSTVPVLALDQSMAAGSLTPGSAVDYVLDVFNLGAKADLVQIRNFLPDGLKNGTWVCSGLGVDCPSASGSGNLASKVRQMPSGSGVHYKVTAQVDNSQPASTSSVLTALPAVGGRCHDAANAAVDSVPCVDRNNTSYAPKLQLSQSATEQQLLRGGIIHHSLTLKNLGGPTRDTRLVLPVASGLLQSEWTCAGFGGAVCPSASGSGAIDVTVENLAFAAYLSYSIRSTLAENAPAVISSIATVTPGAKALCADQECGSSLSVPVVGVPSAHLLAKVRAVERVARAGDKTTWIVDVRNLGSEDAGRFSITNELASNGVSVTGWTCAGAECPAAEGAGAINQVVESLSVYDTSSSEESVARGRIRFTVSGTVVGNAGAQLGVDLHPRAGDTCAPISCQSAAYVSFEQPAGAAVTLDLTSGSFSAYANGSVDYSFTISNFGSVPVSNLPVFSMEPSGVVGSSWTCTAQAGAQCGSPTGTGAINDMIVSLPISSSVTYTILVQLGPTLPPQFDYTAGVDSGTVGVCVPATCTVTLSMPSIQEQMNLSLTADTSVVQPNSTVTYTFVIDSSGNQGSSGNMIDIVGFDSPSFVSSSWTCISTGQSGCTPSGTGPLSTSIQFPSGSETATFTITAQIGPSPPAMVDYFVGIAGGMGVPPGGLNCVPVSCGVQLSLPGGGPSELNLSLSPDTGLVQPNSTVTYTLNIQNNLGADVDMHIQTVEPAGVISSSWSCTSTAGSCLPGLSGPINENFPNMQAGSSMTLTIVLNTGDTLPDPFDFTAVVTPSNGEACSPGCMLTVSLPIAGPAPLDLSLISDVGVAQPGGTINYTFVLIAPTGGSGFQISALDSPDFVTSSWTCQPGGGGDCPSAGVGPLNQSISFLPPGASLTYTVTATLGSTLPAFVDYSVQVLPSQVLCSPASCNVSVSVPVSVPEVDLSLTADVGVVQPDGTINYTFVVNNAGPADATGFDVSAVDSPQFVTSTWTCVGSGGAQCNPSGSGALVESIPLLPAGGALTYTISAMLGSALPPIIDYSVSILPSAGQPSTGCMPASCTVSLSVPVGVPVVELSLNANVGVVQPDSTINYTFVVNNPGPSDVVGFRVFALDSAAFVTSSWTCQGTGGAQCKSGGTGPLDQFFSFLPAGGRLTYTISATVGVVLPLSIDYSVTVLPGGQGQSPQGGLACIPASCSVSLSLPSASAVPAHLSISKTADRAELVPGDSVLYSVRVDNGSNVEATSIRLVDNIPFGLSQFTWSCAGSGGATCPATSGSGALNELLVSMLPGSSLTYSINAVVSSNATVNVTNRAQISGSNITCNPSSCEAESSLPVLPPADIVVSKSSLPASGSRVGVNEPISWTLSAINTGGATTTSLQLRDVLPTSVENISVSPGNGVQCDNLSPVPGSNLTCTIAPGFSGQKSVTINATVASGASGAVVNSVSATGIVGVQCATCSTSNPIGAPIDLAFANPRAFSAGGIAGTLIDIVNLSTVTSPGGSVSVSPASALRLLSPFASACTAVTNVDGSVSVACPAPPQSQGINCVGTTCAIGEIAPGSAMTVFVALEGTAAATVQLSAIGDIDGSNNSIELPIAGTP
ncbi:MAG: hypothetical protein ABIR27_09685 [Dokdonella sp.]